ncbi:LAMI_0C09802g1_1 [Lachancea mirantina]|uniref:LAMI_0C09802g1_1 n=1 Tax=Lachancea mirantina TaxID=1230905 RepID=A0A1G4J642_9SACH|nr:LAMI_0C09802g1_1 [Lachancea mirantina]
MDPQPYSDFYSSHNLLQEFHMLQEKLPINLEVKESGDENGRDSDAETPQSPCEAEEVPVQQPATQDAASQRPAAAMPVRNLDVLEAAFNSLSGKDRIAKIIKYVLDLLRLFVARSRKGITQWDPQVLQYYSKVLAKLNLRLLVRHPVTILKIVVVAAFRNFESRALLVSTSLSMFRQILRFGGTPFRLAKLWSKIARTTEALAHKAQSGNTAVTAIAKIWGSEQSLGDFIDLYYGIMDELMLLHKFKLWSHAGFYSWVAKHEALSWYYDIMLGLKKNWCALQLLNQSQLELQIQLQVKARALQLSSKLRGSTNSPIKQQLLQDLQADHATDTSIQQELDSIQRQKGILYLDLIRLSFDFLANTTDVFHLKTPPGTYAVLSLASGITGFNKIWINCKRDLSGI